MDKEISWFTPPGIGEGIGYGYAAVETIRALQRKQCKVTFQANTLELSKPTHARCHISFVQPDFYQGVPDQFCVGYTPWESSEIPERWKNHMSRMDEIWTTSSYCKDIYEEYNVNDVIRVVPHGIDPEIWKINNRFITDKFVFFHIGGPTARKGGQRVYDAFEKVFGDNENVVLLLKSNGSSECRWYDGKGQYGNANRHPRVQVVESYLEVYELVKLYNAAHCMVYPTSGEGFGLIPFQAIATGLPTIVTEATGTVDFANLSVPLDSKPAPGNGIHLGNWVEPDFDDLCDKMLYVYNNYDKVKEKTLHGAHIIHNNQTWDHIGQQILDIFGDKVTEKI